MACTLIQANVDQILQDLIDSGERKVILVDSDSGTGKTHTLLTLAEKNSSTVNFAMHIRSQASEFRIETHESYFIQHFYRYNSRLNVDSMSNAKVLFELLKLAQSYTRMDSTKVIIMDDCSIMNPLMVVALYLVSLKNNMQLIFSGSRSQLGPIEKTKLNSRTYADEKVWNQVTRSMENRWDSRSNFDVLELISDFKVTNLVENIRFNDPSFSRKVKYFGDAIARCKITEQVPFHFNLRYSLYTLFREKFDPRIPESSDNLFMAQFHKVIKERLKRMKPETHMNHVAYFNAEQLPFNSTDKFMPGLILQTGAKYIHVDESGVERLVVLVDMVRHERTGDLTQLKVMFEDGVTIMISPENFNSRRMLRKYREWLIEELGLSSDIEPRIYNFPLKPYTLTYSAATGRTIGEPVELSTKNLDTVTDFSNATAIYVGLCRLRSESSIHKFHAEWDFPSFVVTDIMAKKDNEEYYYRYPHILKFSRSEVFMPVFRGSAYRTTAKRPIILEHIGDDIGNYQPDEVLTSFLTRDLWELVNDINDFENNTKNRFLKIKRSAYENRMREVDRNTDSPLMKITKFVKNNTDVVERVIRIIEESRLEEAEQTLVEAYNMWENQYRK